MVTALDIERHRDAPAIGDRIDDITKPLDDPRAASSYVAPVLEILSGFLTETTVELMSEAFVSLEKEESR